MNPHLAAAIIASVMIFILFAPEIIETSLKKRKGKNTRKNSKKKKNHNKSKDDISDVINHFHTFVDDLDRYSQIMRDIADSKKNDDESHTDVEIPDEYEYVSEKVGLDPRSPVIEELMGLFDVDIDNITASNLENLYGTISGYYKCLAFIFREYVMIHRKVPTEVREQFRRMYIHIYNAGCAEPSDKVVFQTICKVIEPTSDEIVDEVIALKWGKGAERKTRLTDAGYDYAIIQRRVNRKVNDLYG